MEAHEFVHYQDLSVEQRWGGSDEPTERSLEYQEDIIINQNNTVMAAARKLLDTLNNMSRRGM